MKKKGLSLKRHTREPLLLEGGSKGGKGGRSRIICGSREAAGGHRPRDWRIRAPEEERAELHRSVPLPRGEDAFLRRTSRQADLSLLRLRQRRRRLQFCDGDGEVPIPRGGAHRRGEM